jgi:thiol:disulfide interchange protein DsbD
MRFIVAVLLFIFASLSHAVDEGDLLEPEQAFKFSAQVLDAHTVEVRYLIADGYYLYRNKFKFQVQPTEFSLGLPQFPAAKVKQDQFFGPVEIYHGEVKIRLPLVYSGTVPQSFTLKAVSQGCAEAGVCYSPLEQKAELKLPMALPVSSAAPGSSLLDSLKQLTGGHADDLLPADQAFGLAVTARDATTLLAAFNVAKGYHLYRDKIVFSIKNPVGITIAKVNLPPAETLKDPIFGKTEAYLAPFRAEIILLGAKAGDKVTLAAKYQGCAEKGVCYPPINKTFDLIMKGEMQAGADASLPPSSPQAVTQVSENESDSAQIERLFKGGSFWVVMLSFFGFGLLLSLTPCVFPMIPILSGIIVGEGHKLTKRKSFGLSLAYVLGMAVTYALAGIAAGLSGTLISNALQNPWALGTGAAIFVALAMSMFGFYDLQMPSFIQSRLTEDANKLKGGRYWAVFVMGALSAVIVGPCVAAPLAGALLYIGQTHDVVLGGAALFSMAWGMGVPLLLIGLSAGTLLPRAGAWMQGVKNFFGVAMLGIAIWLISPLISPALNMLLWATLLIVSAIHLHAIDPLPVNAHGFSRLWKGIGVIALVAGVALLIGVLAGSRDILQPLATLRAASGGEARAMETSPKFGRVKTVTELEERIKAASGRYVMLDFYADWCVSCKELERFTFSDPRVQTRLKDVELLQVDVTANSQEDKALLKKLGLFGPPGIIFFDRSGAEIKSRRVIGYEPPEKFLQSLNSALK